MVPIERRTGFNLHMTIREGLRDIRGDVKNLEKATKRGRMSLEQVSGRVQAFFDAFDYGIMPARQIPVKRSTSPKAEGMDVVEG